MSDDVVYHAAGNSPVSGVHKGKQKLIENAQKSSKHMQATHQVTLKQLISNDTYVAAVDTWSAQRKDGKKIKMDNLLVYKIEDGKITEVREFLGDEAAHDSFWK